MYRNVSPASYGQGWEVALASGISALSNLFTGGGGGKSSTQTTQIIYPPGTNYVPIIIAGVVIIGLVVVASISGAGSTIVMPKT
jgi:hypothetical protein